jgi:hypothetical protein
MLVIVYSMLFVMLLSVTMQHYMLAQKSVRRRDAGDAALHAARGAVRWAEGVIARNPSFRGVLKRPHELGTIEVTVDAEVFRATLRGRTAIRDRGTERWREE